MCDNRNICWLAWDKMMAYKENRGADIGSVGTTNKLLLVKWLWRYKHEKEKLWAKCITSLHQSRRTHHDTPVKKSSGPWRNIMKGINDLNQLGFQT